MATKIYGKFTVIKNEDIRKYLTKEQIGQLLTISSVIQAGRMKDGKTAGNLYYVVNQDEPYAEDVLQLILKGEDNKQNPKKDCIEAECEYYEPLHPNHYCALPVREKCPHGCSIN